MLCRRLKDGREGKIREITGDFPLRVNSGNFVASNFDIIRDKRIFGCLSHYAI